MNMIPSPLSLDLTNTRAFKTWLYQLWQSTGGTTSTAIEDIDVYLSTGGTTSTAIEDIDVYLSTPAIDVINGSQLDQVLLMQIRDELAEINKKLDEMQINERTVLDDVNKKIDEVVILLGVSL